MRLEASKFLTASLGLAAALSCLSGPATATAAWQSAPDTGLKGCNVIGKVISLADGDTLVAGATRSCITAAPYPVYRAFVARFDDRGNLVEGFGDHGISLIGPSIVAPTARPVYDPAKRRLGGAIDAAQVGDETLVAGPNFVARLDAHGRPDPDFGQSGVRSIDTGGTGSYRIFIVAMTVQPDGRILLAGATGPYDPRDYPRVPVVLRLLPDGRPDPSFGVDGRAIIHLGSDSDPVTGVPASIALDPTGKILVGGSFTDAPGATDLEIGFHYAGVIRLSPDGSPDPGYGSANGVAYSRTPGLVTNDYAATAAWLWPGADGSVAIGSEVYAGIRPCEMGFTADLDPSGRPVGTPALLQERVGCAQQNDMVRDSGGRTLALPGLNGIDTPRFTVARFLPAGAADPGFGDAGSAGFELGTGTSVAEAADIDGSGRILVAGLTDPDGCGEDSGPGPCVVSVILARFGEAGTLDPTFGDRGLVVLPKVFCPHGLEDAPGAYGVCAWLWPRPRFRARVGHAASRRPALRLRVANPVTAADRIRVELPKRLRLRHRAKRRTKISVTAGGVTLRIHRFRLRGHVLTAGLPMSRRTALPPAGSAEAETGCIWRIRIKRGGLKPIKRRNLRRKLRYKVTQMLDDDGYGSPKANARVIRSRPSHRKHRRRRSTA